MAEIEKELIQRALQRWKGNKTRAAKLLGMSRARLHRRIEFFGLIVVARSLSRSTELPLG